MPESKHTLEEVLVLASLLVACIGYLWCPAGLAKDLFGWLGATLVVYRCQLISRDMHWRIRLMTTCALVVAFMVLFVFLLFRVFR